MCLAFFIRRARYSRGLSQEELARKLGVSRATLANWETDRFLPSFKYWPKLQWVLRIPLAELVNAREEKRSERLERKQRQRASG
jgi:ribosome-binding protein aMBF1 (putative translation factor)